MKINVKLSSESVALGEAFTVEPVILGAVMKEEVQIKEIVKLRNNPKGDAIEITSVVPVSTSGDAISIGGS